jgi:protein MpaA
MREPESRWLVAEIGLFQPDVIITTHAPHGIVDFDGPPEGPSQVGSLGQKLLGTFPGSLGNFAGQQRDLPVVTVEFSSASSMPDREDIESMWADLQGWLLERFPEPKKAALLSRGQYSHFFEVESKFEL